MKIKGLILGNIGSIVRNGNTLKAMAKKGFFKYPVDDTKNPYVDDISEESKVRNFKYKAHDYCIEYMSGCFYPFVIKKS